MNKSIEAYRLDNKQWLFQRLQEVSMVELGKELGLSRGSIAWATRSFTQEEQALFITERAKRKPKLR